MFPFAQDNPMPRNSTASLRAGLNPHQREQFLETGVVFLPGLVPRPDAEAMADRLWDTLARQHGHLRNRPDTWTKQHPAQFQELRRSGAFAAMGSERVRGLLDDLFGDDGWTPPAHWGGPLVTFPTGEGPWRVPAATWHLDIHPGQVLEPWPDYVRLFAILAPLEPGGGGTVYVAGSHRLSMQMMAETPSRGQIRSAGITEALTGESPWIAALRTPGDEARRNARFMDEGARARGIDLRVGEMTGQPGDVVLMHPATLHAPARNARATPRLMLAETVYAKR
jgi:ectoine hydroxylase-related dioxygenase (phytanoyl-CoA dioxygenase family)